MICPTLRASTGLNFYGQFEIGNKEVFFVTTPSVTLFQAHFRCTCLKTYREIFFDLRNMFQNRRKVRKFSETKKIQLSKISSKKICLNLRKYSQNNNNFVEMRTIFLLRKVSVRYVQGHLFLPKTSENFSQ